MRSTSFISFKYAMTNEPTHIILEIQAFLVSDIAEIYDAVALIPALHCTV
jgi:hypothetical protein